MSNVTIFYQDNTYVRTKLSIFVAVLTKSAAVCGCRLYGYQYKSFLIHQKGKCILGGQSKTDVLSNLTIFYPTNSCVGAKLSIFVSVLTKSTTLYGCRLYRHQLKAFVRSSETYINPERAIRVRLLVFLSRTVTKLLKFSPSCLLQTEGWSAKTGGVGLKTHLPFSSQAL